MPPAIKIHKLWLQRVNIGYIQGQTLRAKPVIESYLKLREIIVQSCRILLRVLAIQNMVKCKRILDCADSDVCSRCESQIRHFGDSFPWVEHDVCRWLIRVNHYFVFILLIKPKQPLRHRPIDIRLPQMTFELRVLSDSFELAAVVLDEGQQPSF